MDIKSIKERGRKAFKANYWPCVLAALILTIVLGAVTTAGGNSVNNSASDAAAEMQTLSDQVISLTPEELTVVVVSVAAVIAFVTIVGFVVRIFLFNPLQVGCYRFFKNNAENPPAKLGDIKEGFGSYGHTFATLFLKDLFLCLWTLLFIIPGIIKAYSYQLVPYIVKDNPELSAMQAIKRSKELMNGHKWEAFVLDLSFIGWYLLSILTLGILNIFWTSPYSESAHAVFYLDILAQEEK